MRRSLIPDVPFAAALPVLLPSVSLAQTPPATLAVSAPSNRAEALKRLEKTIEEQRVKLGVPGIALAIIENDRVVFSKGFGFRDQEKKLPVTPETLFAIGSATKAFTALSALQAQDAGLISLSAHPRTYLPYFQINDPDTDKNITVRDLLCHRSGLTRTDLTMVTGKLSREELIRVAGQAKPATKLGEKWQYQNLMYTAAGEATARTRHQDYDKLIADDIFRPLGMTASNLSEMQFSRSANHAQGYALKMASHTAVPIPFRDIHATAPAGSINSNITDMAQWIRFWLRGDGTFNGKRLVSQAGFDDATRQQITISGSMGYGLGWFLRQWNGEKVVEHGGNIDGFSTSVGFVPGKKLGWVLLTNVSYSPLQSGIIPLVMTTLAPPPTPKLPADAVAAAEDAVARVDAKDEAGDYLIKEANVTIPVAFKDGKLLLMPPGQPALPLENVRGRRYKMGALAPDGMYATFRPSKDDSKSTELFLEQPQGNVVLVRRTAPAAGEAATAVWKSPLTTDELLTRMIAAFGGEAALKRHQTRTIISRIVWENQGLTGQAIEKAALLNRSQSKVSIRALHKEIGWVASTCDGKNVTEWGSFVPTDHAEGKSLAKGLVESDFNDGLLNARDLFTLEIKRREIVNGEDTFVLLKTPKNGAPPIVDFVSLSTFRLVRRDTLPSGEGSGVPSSELFSNYRWAGDVMLPFTRSREDAAMGRVVATIEKVEWNRPINPKTFQGPTTK